MSVDIISRAEVRNKQTGEWELIGDHFSDRMFYSDKKTANPFNWRSYRLFAFLTNDRNDFGIESIPGVKGIPDDATGYVKSISTGYYDGSDDVQGDCLYLEDMLNFDYEKAFVNKRNDETVSYRDFLGEDYFDTIEELKSLGDPGDVRVLFWFSY